MQIQGLKKMASELINKLSEKQPKIIKHLCHQKILFLCVCVCIKWTHLLYSLKKHGEKNDVEVIEYGGEIWL